MKLPHFITNHTVSFFSNTIKPEVLFIISICCFPIFLLLPTTQSLWIAVGIFFILTLLKRGSVRILPSLCIIASVVFFSLLSPYGKVLFVIHNFRITQGALENGLHRSGVLVGMVFLSQFSVSKSLHFPGRFGTFIASIFTTFDKLTAQHISLKPGHIISSIDERLITIWNQEHEDSAS